ncbi:MAG TPA: hypothetical protein PK916_15970, partial [Bacteroidota bacterium]|nr:hypothetical protein [Bacteroidota bacterium]
KHNAGSETIFRADCTDFTQISTDGSWKSASIRVAAAGKESQHALSAATDVDRRRKSAEMLM